MIEFPPPGGGLGFSLLGGLCLYTPLMGFSLLGSAKAGTPMGALSAICGSQNPPLGISPTQSPPLCCRDFSLSEPPLDVPLMEFFPLGV